jgi:hypothetical protein
MIWITIMVDIVEVARPLVHSQTHIHPFNHVTVENSRSKYLFWACSEAYAATTVFTLQYNSERTIA